MREFSRAATLPRRMDWTMQGVPEPYDKFLVLEGGERPLYSWLGMAVRMDGAGRVYSTSMVRGRYGYHPAQINTKDGLVLLTTRRIHHYRRSGPMGIYGVGRDARFYMGVPFSSIQKVQFLKGLTEHVLQFEVSGEVQYAAPDGTLAQRSEQGGLHFAMAFGEDLQQMVDTIWSAMQQGRGSMGSADLGGSGAGPDQPLSSGGGSSGGVPSFIHLHAESEE